MTDNEDMLARLIAQLAERGADLVTLRALIEEASELGAGRALERLGLADPHVRRDLDELRVLLGAWRDAKSSAMKAALGWIVKLMLALALFGLALKLGFGGWLKG